MLEKPNLPDENIVACLQEHYGLSVDSLEFLPIGNDATAWVYKLGTIDEKSYFLKLKRGAIVSTNLTVPRYLHEAGILQVVSPIPNQTQALWTALADFNLTVYPFINGQAGMSIGLSREQWHAFGAVLKRIHATALPSELAQQVPREVFILNPNWMRAIQAIESILKDSSFKDNLEESLAIFWRENSLEIAQIIRRARELGGVLQSQSLPFVLCHADIHTANILIDGVGELHIVDWDQTVFAPKERDLMFVVGGNDPALDSVESEQAFLDSYGKLDIQWTAIAYYRYEWVVQEIADFGERVFLAQDTGEETKFDAVRGFKQLFLPGDVITAAYGSESQLI